MIKINSYKVNELNENVQIEEIDTFMSMKTIISNNLEEYNEVDNEVFSDASHFIHMAIKLNDKLYTNYTKLVLKIKQTNNNDNDLYLYKSNQGKIIQDNYEFKFNIVYENNDMYRIIDISEILNNNPNSTNYFIIKTKDGVNVKLYNENSDFKPIVIINYFEDYDFYKKQKYLTSNIGDANVNVNIRTGQTLLNTDLISINTPLHSFNISLYYNSKQSYTNIINDNYNTYLPYGFKFNINQYVFKSGANYKYIDDEYKIHTFKLADNLTEESENKIYYETDGNYLTLTVDNNLINIKNELGDNLQFNNFGQLISITNRLNNLEKEHASIVIYYENFRISSIRLNYYDSNSGSRVLVSCYFNYIVIDNNTSYIFINLNNNIIETDNIETLKNQSTAYIKCTNNLLTEFKTLHGDCYELLYQTICHTKQLVNYHLVNKIKQYNNSIEINYNNSLKAYNVCERVKYNNINAIKKDFILNFKGLSTETITRKNANITLSKVIYLFNNKQELEGSFDNINNKIERLEYTYEKNNYTISIADNINDIFKNYNFVYHNGSAIINNLYPVNLFKDKNMQTIVTIIKLDQENNYFVQGEVKLKYYILNEETGNENIDDEHTIILNNSKYYFYVYNRICGNNESIESIKVTIQSNYKLSFDHIVFNGYRQINYKYLSNRAEDIFVDFNFPNVNLIFNELNINNIKLSFNDMSVNYSNFNVNKNPLITYYNFWYNDGKNFVSNISHAFIKLPNINSTFELRIFQLYEKKYDIDNEYHISFTYPLDIQINNYDLRIKESIKSLSHNTVISCVKVYDKNKLLIETIDNLGIKNKYEYNVFGRIIKHTLDNHNKITIINDYEVLFNCDLDVNNSSDFYIKEKNYTSNGIDVITYLYNNLGKNYAIYDNDLNCIWMCEFDGKNRISSIKYKENNNYIVVNQIEYNDNGLISKYINNDIEYQFIYGYLNYIIEIKINTLSFVSNSYLIDGEYVEVTSTYHGSQNSINPQKYKYKYDKFNRLIEIEEYSKDLNGFKKLLTNYYGIKEDTLGNSYIDPINNDLNRIASSLLLGSYKHSENPPHMDKYIYNDSYKLKNKITSNYNIQFLNNKEIDINENLLMINKKEVSNYNKIITDELTFSQSVVDNLRNINYIINNKYISFGRKLNNIESYENITDISELYSKANVHSQVIVNKDETLIQRSLCDLKTSPSKTLIKKYEYYDNNTNNSEANYQTNYLKCEKLINEDNVILSQTTYEYYDNGSIKKETRQIGNNAYFRLFTYDKLNRLIREDNEWSYKTMFYTYDVAGNITNKERFSFNIGDPYLDQEALRYSYYRQQNHLNNNLLSHYDNKEYFYNYNGELYYSVEDYTSTDYTWYHNQLRKIKFGETEIEFIYNDEGLRCKKILKENGEEKEITKYLYDGTKIIEQVKQIKQINNEIEEYVLTYIYDNDNVIGFYYNNEIYLFNTNALGEIIEIYKDGALFASYRYDAWGRHTAHNLASPLPIDDPSHVALLNSFRYKGYIYDDETNLALVASRYYSPELGRFIQPADVSSLNPQSINGLNLYTYANNNPICFSYNNSSAVGSTNVAGGLVSSIGTGNSFIGNVNSGSPSKGGLNLGWLKNGLDTGSTIHGLYTSISGLVNHTAYFAKNLTLFADDMTMLGASMKDGVLAFNQFSWGLGKSDIFGIALGVGLDIYDSIQREVSPGGVVLGATLTAAKGVGLIYLNKGILYGATALGSAICPGVGTVVGFVVGGIVCIVVDIFASNWLDDLIDKIAK